MGWRETAQDARVLDKEGLLYPFNQKSEILR